MQPMLPDSVSLRELIQPILPDPVSLRGLIQPILPDSTSSGADSADTSGLCFCVCVLCFDKGLIQT